jgi:hypothetical protein
VPTLQFGDNAKRIMQCAADKTQYVHKTWFVWTKKWSYRLKSMKQYWHSLQGTEKILAHILLSMTVLIVVQFVWILSLQYQMNQLTAAAEIREIRITNLEQSEKKQNSILYSTYSTIWDLQKQWNDLNFRVLENSWKLGN